MADKMRWRYGDTNPAIVAVDASTVIEIGDLLYLDVNDAKPASSQADGGTEAANQTTFAGLFLGVAMQRSKSGETDPIRVATSGVFEFDCPSKTYELGELTGASEHSNGTQLLDQQVEYSVTAARSIGRVAKRASTATTTVLVDIQSKVMGLDGLGGSAFTGSGA